MITGFIITTKYLRANKKHGTRIMARTVCGAKVKVPYPYELPPDQRHLVAAKALIDLLPTKYLFDFRSHKILTPAIVACGYVPHGMVYVVGEGS